jgi:hypothetical protein
MTLPRLTHLTAFADKEGRPASLFQRFWNTICEAIEAPAGVTDTPATAASPGKQGQIAYDATHFYVCIAADTWVRCTLATW